jgi:DNA repair protein RecO (recombination protein O)
VNTFKTRGIVLRVYATGEADKRLVILCKGYGRLTVLARGAAKPNSKRLAASQLLTYGDFIVADGRGFKSLTQAEVIEGFYPIRNDYERLCHAQRLLEICDKTIPDETPCDEILLLLIKSLQHIGKGTVPPRQTAGVFLLRFLMYNGVAPDIEHCGVCGAATETGKGILFCDEGAVCAECGKRTTKPMLALSAAAVAAVRHILVSDENAAFKFRVGDHTLIELDKAGEMCFKGHFRQKIQAWEFM